ncbi:MAG: hypothetical protein ACE5HB_04040 [Terriglobia bacterium]
MKGNKLVGTALVAATLLGGGATQRAATADGQAKAKHHHDLRGVIVKVDPAKDEFEIKTNAGRIVLCFLDKESTVRRGSKKVTLKDVQPGERARCHCAALQKGRHYSQTLQLEPRKKEKKD